MKSKKFKKITIILFSFIFTGALFAAGKKEDIQSLFLYQGQTTNIQAIYDDMSDLIPVVVYFQPTSTTGVEFDYVRTLDYELKKQMVEKLLFKPVLMNKWLDSTYGEKKFSSIFQLVNVLKNERYSVNLSGVFKSYIYKVGKNIILKLSIYPFSTNGYPISSVRIIKSEKEIPEAVTFMLSDMSTMYKNKTSNEIKLAVEPFTIECKTLIEQKTGEFDFISTSFSEQEGVEIKSSDDYFSELFAYQAKCTGLYEAVTIQNLDEYIRREPNKINTYNNMADYLIKGKVTLTNLYNIISIDIVDIETEKVIKTLTHITKKIDLAEIWNNNYKFISAMSLDLYNPKKIKIIENIDNMEKCFYMNGMFAGFDNIQNIPVKTGKTIINTGNNLTSDYSLNENFLNSKKNEDFFIYASADEIYIYKGRDGAYIWNLLKD